jgi:hypothetical protein
MASSEYEGFQTVRRCRARAVDWADASTSTAAPVDRDSGGAAVASLAAESIVSIVDAVLWRGNAWEG